MRPVHGGCWWALLFAVVVPVAVAGPAVADTTIQVEAGYGGWFVPGQGLPVRVRVSADRLVRGTLEVGVGKAENGVPAAMAVEIPGGSEKEFLLTTVAGVNTGPDVTATLRQDNRLIASGATTARPAGDTELVGVLPGALRGRALPGTSPLAVDAGTATFAPVGEAELEQAPASLGPLSTLAADVDDLVRLSPAARAAVLQWIEDGGRLLVDTPKGQAVPGLPDAWQPGRRGRATAGLGEVVATDGAAAAGRWSGLVEPSAWGLVSNRFPGDMSVASSLAAEAGLRTPRVGWLVAFLAVYVIVVGPVLFLAVRRLGRPELAWIAVPLVALLFASGSYVVGHDLRKATGLVHASVLSSGVDGPRATSYVGVFSRTGETATVGFPVGWSSGGSPDIGQSGPLPSVVVTTADGPDVRMPLDAGQFGLVRASGPAPHAGGLEIHATGGPGTGVSGVLKNATAFTLDNVAVFAGAGGTVVGSLGPGQERNFEIGNVAQGRGGPGIEFQMWGGMPADGRGIADQLGLWQAAMRGVGVNYRAPGAVVAAGFTREFSPEIRIHGRTTRPDGPTIVLARQQVETAPGLALELAARRDVVRDPFADRFQAKPRTAGSVVRFVLPDGADTSKLVLHSPFGMAELWQDGAWQPAACTGGACPPSGPAGPNAVACPPNQPCPPLIVRGPVAPDYAVPAPTVHDGVVYVRVQGSVSGDTAAATTLGRSS